MVDLKKIPIAFLNKYQKRYESNIFPLQTFFRIAHPYHLLSGKSAIVKYHLGL